MRQILGTRRTQTVPKYWNFLSMSNPNCIWYVFILIIARCSGQIEKKFKDGTSEIQFPDGVIKKSKIDGSQDTIYADGSVVTIFPDGHKILLLPNGQKEVHTKDHMVSFELSIIASLI